MGKMREGEGMVEEGAIDEGEIRRLASSLTFLRLVKVTLFLFCIFFFSVNFGTCQ